MGEQEALRLLEGGHPGRQVEEALLHVWVDPGVGGDLSGRWAGSLSSRGGRSGSQRSRGGNGGGNGQPGHCCARSQVRRTRGRPGWFRIDERREPGEAQRRHLLLLVKSTLTSKTSTWTANRGWSWGGILATWWAAALGAHSVHHHNHRLEKIFLSEHAPAVKRKQRPVDQEHLAINRESLHSLLDCGAVETPNTFLFQI